MTIEIREIAGTAAFTEFGQLITTYVAWLRAEYASAGDSWFVAEVLDKQDLNAELAGLADVYAPPSGRAFLAYRQGQPVACGAYRRLNNVGLKGLGLNDVGLPGAACCEMKRMFVAPAARGLGAGRSLAQQLMQSARADGYTHMLLDSGKRLSAAHSLYASLGFAPCPAYGGYPAKLQSHLVFMATDLGLATV